MNAGKRHDKITIQRKTVETDPYGGEVETWTDFAQEWAQVRFGSGQERREAAQETASQAATFIVLDNARTRSVGVQDRISWDGGLWDVTGVAPSLQLNAHREITAVRAAQ